MGIGAQHPSPGRPALLCSIGGLTSLSSSRGDKQTIALMVMVSWKSLPSSSLGSASAVRRRKRGAAQYTVRRSGDTCSAGGRLFLPSPDNSCTFQVSIRSMTLHSVAVSSAFGSLQQLAYLIPPYRFGISLFKIISLHFSFRCHTGYCSDDCFFVCLMWKNIVWSGYQWKIGAVA